jgi:hypothetical protein
LVTASSASFSSDMIVSTVLVMTHLVLLGACAPLHGFPINGDQFNKHYEVLTIVPPAYLVRGAWRWSWGPPTALIMHESMAGMFLNGSFW